MRLKMTEMKMLMIENIVTGQRSNFSAMTLNSSMNYIKNQEKINESITSLFDNISPSDRYVFNDSLSKDVENIQAMQLSAINTGLVHLAMETPEFSNYGSDYVNLSIIKKAYDKFDDSVMLSEEGNKLLQKYNLEPSQLNAFDSDELLDSLKDNQKNLSVHYLTNKTNTFMVHSISGFKPDANSPIQGDITHLTKVELLRSVNPEISCSTFVSGVNHENVDFGYSTLGVIISGGSVLFASGGDAGTKVDANGKRYNYNSQIEQSEIEQIFKDRDYGGLNEIVVKKPQIAGAYLNLDARKENERGFNITQSISPNNLISSISMLNTMTKDTEKPLPQLVVYKGQLREVSFDIEKIKEFKESLESPSWHKLSDKEFLDKFATIGEPLTHKKLSELGESNDLSNSRKLELLDKNENSLRGNIISNKVAEIRGKTSQDEINMNFSVFDNLNYQKTKSYLPDYAHKFKNASKLN